MSGENQGGFSDDNLKAYAVDLGLNADEFNTCLDTGKYTEKINQKRQIAQQLGVSSTPAFVINGQAILGAQPFENFQQIIDAELQK